ncbi:YfbK domain-containing protein, partial [Rhizobium leguminosarum]|uniref:YfbK domain-containing protein n=1 Tax=Rhizobium leguminosarum TaxID=384 RepID=UPI003F9E78F6
ATVDAAPQDVRFSVAVAAFGQKLSHFAAVDTYSYQAIADLAAASRGTDTFGYRSYFLGLVRLADAGWRDRPGLPPGGIWFSRISTTTE